MATPFTEDVPLGEGMASYGALPTEMTSIKVQDNFDKSVGYQANNNYGMIYGDEKRDNSQDELTSDTSGIGHQMALYEDDLSERGGVSRMLSRLSMYKAGLTPDPSDDTENGNQYVSAHLGTFLGVYLPCIQNIVGVILFIRMTWVVGMAGVLESFWIVFICCFTTLLTAISMSAIATNGVVAGGGSYFMISRALGPEFGGAVGMLFYLGTTVASSLYIIGAVEILVKYIAPVLSLFGDVTVTYNAYNNYRVYGTILLLLLICLVLFGVRFVSRLAPVSLFCVLLSIISIYIGIFASGNDNSFQICLLGNRTLRRNVVEVDGEIMCNKNITGPLYRLYCQNNNSESCDPYFTNHETRLYPGIPGLGSGIFHDNIYNDYTDRGDIPGTEIVANRTRGEIAADITTSFTVLLAIFFPAVTGIMAGSNRSGDLADAQKSIPIGTICAIITSSLVYLSCVLFFGGTIHGALLRDKFGESIGGGLVIAHLSWPTEWIVLIGSFLSTVGAALQTLTGAPRLLQAIAKDGVIPFLKLFSVTTKRGEPIRAIVMTAVISEIGVVIASLDYVAPIITMFFLMCYGFVNMACALQTLLKTPNWRPRFRFYHWTLSLLGMSTCVALMFVSSWYYALTAIVLAVFIYKYIEYKGAEKEWGDGIRGLAQSAARYALLNLEQGPPHTKNWRPQLLVLMKLNSQLNPKYEKMVAFVGQFRAGKGLMMLASVIEGDFKEKVADAQAAKQMLSQLIERHGTKGFADVIVAQNVTQAISDIIQSAGLGGLRHNTVVLGWPYGWRHNPHPSSFRVFLDTVKTVADGQLCLMVLKGIEFFPESNDRLVGTIDIWWIVHEGGLLMLLPFLLRQHKTWKNCNLRIFTVAQSECESSQMRRDLEKYLYHMRIEAEVVVVVMSNSDISAYTYERTVMMEQRTEFLRNMRPHTKGKKVKLKPQMSLDTAMSDDRYSPDVTLDTDNQFTFSPPPKEPQKPQEQNIRRMHTAVRLNEVIVENSHLARLVILNMPASPKQSTGDENYMEYLEVLTEGLDTVVMVRGSGREVITMYS